MKLFNFHTHNPAEKYGIINLNSDINIDDNKKYSIGIHPWDYSSNWIKKIEEISKSAKPPSIVAIGETGLDPKSPVKLSKQLEIFQKHIEISELHQLPLIIHCVKYYNELIKIRKQLFPKQPWIIHGYNSKTGTLQQLIDAGFYISVNYNLLKHTKKAEETLRIAGLDKIFIETDDGNEDISTNYKLVADYFGCSINKINNQIIKNLEKIGVNVA
ncbi:MAG: TatD family hydrolase [Bacteroidales bacterium]|nr:TatD family hydrolase [Bacteroidales bacterium]